jgi:hypothetical protein
VSRIHVGVACMFGCGRLIPRQRIEIRVILSCIKASSTGCNPRDSPASCSTNNKSTGAGAGAGAGTDTSAHWHWLWY